MAKDIFSEARTLASRLRSLDAQREKLLGQATPRVREMALASLADEAERAEPEQGAIPAGAVEAEGGES